ADPTSLRRCVPAQDPERAQRVPAAGPAVAVLEREVHQARMGVLEPPRAVVPPPSADDGDGPGAARVGRPADGAEVLEPSQHVVVPLGWERERQPVLVDDLTRAGAQEERTGEEVLLGARSCLGDGEVAAGPLVLQQTLEDADRGVEG